jgi:hypothetical protein
MKTEEKKAPLTIEQRIEQLQNQKIQLEIALVKCEGAVEILNQVLTDNE